MGWDGWVLQMTNITEFPTKPDPFKTAVEEAARNLDSHLQFIRLVAVMRKELFDALVKEGFTELQALEIVKVWKVGT